MSTDEPRWWQDAQHGPYVAESLSDGMTARVVYYATPYSQLGEIVETFTGETAWSDAARAAQDHHHRDRTAVAEFYADNVSALRKKIR